MSAEVGVAESIGTPAQSYYRVSALVSGFARMRFMWKVALPVVIVNALIQALLIIPSSTTGMTGVFLVTVVISALVLIGSAALIQASSIEGATAPTGWSAALSRVRASGVKYSITITLLAVAVMVGLMLNMWLGLVIAVVLCFLTLAAIDGAVNPIAANFRTIAARPFRWLSIQFIIGCIAAVLWLLMVANWFFIPTPAGSFIATFVGGLVTWWWSNSLALIYLSAKSARVEVAPDIVSAPDSP